MLLELADMLRGQVSVLRRHRLWRDDGKPDFHALDKGQFARAVAEELECIQRELARVAVRAPHDEPDGLDRLGAGVLQTVRA